MYTFFWLDNSKLPVMNENRHEILNNMNPFISLRVFTSEKQAYHKQTNDFSLTNIQRRIFTLLL